MVDVENVAGPVRLTLLCVIRDLPDRLQEIPCPLSRSCQSRQYVGSCTANAMDSAGEMGAAQQQ